MNGQCQKKIATDREQKVFMYQHLVETKRIRATDLTVKIDRKLTSVRQKSVSRDYGEAT